MSKLGVGDCFVNVDNRGKIIEIGKIIKIYNNRFNELVFDYKCIYNCYSGKVATTFTERSKFCMRCKKINEGDLGAYLI